MNKNYTVYMHTNLENNKKYIGITKQKPEYRWSNGRGYIKQSIFFNAIIECGWRNFSHEILYTGLTEEEACAREKELIAYFDTTNPLKGYNICVGGLGHSIPKCEQEQVKEITQDTKRYHRGKIVCLETGAVYDSAVAASKATGVAHVGISNCCRGKAKTAGKLHWCYQDAS